MFVSCRSLYKINMNRVSDVTTFDLGLNNMTFVAVFETPRMYNLFISKYVCSSYTMRTLDQIIHDK